MIVIEILAEIFYFVWSLIVLTLSIKEDLFVYFWFLYLVFYAFCMWKLFERAGVHGIYALIPFVNVYYIFKFSFGSGFVALLLFVPFLNNILLFLLPFFLARTFGRNFLFGLGLYLFDIIFLPILVFSKKTYFLQRN